MSQVTVQELKEWNETGRDYLLVDIREGWERDNYHIGGKHIPMGVLFNKLHEIPRDKDVILYCEKGVRSAIALQRLQTYGYNNVRHLSGGVKAWKETL